MVCYRCGKEESTGVIIKTYVNSHSACTGEKYPVCNLCVAKSIRETYLKTTKEEA